MKQSFRINLSATTIQLLTNQLFSLVVFYFLSKGLTKNDFGELNWTLAVFLALFSFLSFGIDQLIVKKIAEGKNKAEWLALHFFHVLVSGFLLYFVLIGLTILFPDFFRRHELLLLIGAGKLFLYLSTPFKAIASGTENFKAVLSMSVSSAIIKGLGILWLYYANEIHLPFIVLVFIVADCSELLLGLYLTRNTIGTEFSWKISISNYLKLVREAFPQIGIVLFSSALARIDWLLIGLFLTASNLAEYSFAYKAFEVSSLPLLAIAPLLVPYFTRQLRGGKKLDSDENVHLLLRMEMVIACLASLCLNLLWNPLVDRLTAGKYGEVNTTTIFLLSVSLPVLYLNNFLWSIHFASGRLRFIFFSFALCFAANLIGNLCLIPTLGNNGAALAYLLSLAIQTVIYAAGLKGKVKLDWQPFFICSLCAVLSGTLSKYSSLTLWWIVPICVTCYFFLLYCTIQLRKTDWPNLKRAMNL